MSANQLLKKLITPEDDNEASGAAGCHASPINQCTADELFQLAPVLGVLTHQLIYQARILGADLCLDLGAERGDAAGVAAVDADAARQDAQQALPAFA